MPPNSAAAVLVLLTLALIPSVGSQSFVAPDSCAKSCFYQFALDSGCSVYNGECLCTAASTTTLHDSLKSCAVSACSNTGYTEDAEYFRSICANEYGISYSPSTSAPAASSSSTPPPSSNDSNSNSNSNSNNSSTKIAIGAGVGGGIIAIIGIAIGICFWRRYRKLKHQNNGQPNGHVNAPVGAHEVEGRQLQPQMQKQTYRPVQSEMRPQWGPQIIYQPAYEVDASSVHGKSANGNVAELGYGRYK